MGIVESRLIASLDTSGDGRSYPIDDQQEPSYLLFAAIYDPATAVVERTLLRAHRDYLVDDLHGAVLDIGAGTGAMFPYFAVANGSASFHAIEPDPYMRRQAREKADELGLERDLRSAGAESLPYEDDSFDVVIASIVFCTIPDIEVALSEVARVLRLGGGFRFFEHVLDDGWRSHPVPDRTALEAGRRRMSLDETDRIGVLAADRSFDIVEVDRMNLSDRSPTLWTELLIPLSRT